MHIRSLLGEKYRHCPANPAAAASYYCCFIG